jgi:hypothetical protein
MKRFSMLKLVGLLCLNLVIGVAVYAAEGKKCVALRDNGHYVSAHFGAMARILEDHGLIKGVAGGSSSTLTAFIYDSILENPNIKNETDEIKQRRSALLMKSVYGLMDMINDRGLTLLLGETASHRELLLRLLNSKEDAERAAAGFEFQHGVDKIINREFINFAFDTNGGVDFRRSQALEAVRNLSTFRVRNPVPLIRPGVFNFGAFGPLAAKLGNFYAQRDVDKETEKNFGEWIAACDLRTVGMSWAEMANEQSPPDVSNCVYDFLNIALQGIKRKSTTNLSMHREAIGLNTEVLISTGLIVGDKALTQLNELKHSYNHGIIPEHLEINYEDLKFGYWSSSEPLLRKVAAGLKAEFHKDAKSVKFYPIEGRPKWETVLKYSPAEPGLSEALLLDWYQRIIAIGGWSDLEPVQVLKAAGCSEIYYVTRSGLASDLSMDMVKLFDQGEKHLDELYFLPTESGQKPEFTDTDPLLVSSYRRALENVTGGVLCTDWDSKSFANKDSIGLGEEGYRAKMVYPSQAAVPTNRLNRAVEIKSEKTAFSCRPGL